MLVLQQVRGLPMQRCLAKPCIYYSIILLLGHSKAPNKLVLLLVKQRVKRLTLKLSFKQ